ncbi:aromatic ring-hydroxylating dioxygenase subunit alpha, partial [Myxococcota bacterium]|nr:aromatic ring-hydroxylating dioxygenase subunit alpha [Myxococcota bacterium]
MASPRDWQSQPAPAWTQPRVGNHPIHGHRYTSREFFALEWENMWTRVWLLLGRESAMPNAGDYQVEDVGHESFILIRQADGVIRAFYNVCRHRGTRLLKTPQGNLGDALTCPAHGWGYRADGTICEARGEFRQGHPCDGLQLVEVPCDTFIGFVFINMDPDCVPLREFLGPIGKDWPNYHPENWMRYSALTARMPCNWKVIQDNFHESYHLLTVHPELTVSIDEHYSTTQF